MLQYISAYDVVILAGAEHLEQIRRLQIRHLHLSVMGLGVGCFCLAQRHAVGRAVPGFLQVLA